MKRALITIALLALLALAVPGAMLAQSENVSLEGLAGYVRALQHRVRAVEERLPALEEQVIGIFFRLGKVEAYEKRISALERRIAELEDQAAEPLPASGAPSEIPSEGVIEMTEAQYKRWFDGELLRIVLLVPEWEAAMESDDAAAIFSAIFDALDTVFGFYDTHSRIVTPHSDYEKIQSNLACYMDPLEPFRDLENTTVADLIPLFIALASSEDSEDFFIDCDPKAFDGLEELLSLE